MKSSCPNGYIRRKGYTRKDAAGKKIRVKSKCIKSTRSPGYRNQKRSTWAKKYLAAKAKSHHSAAVRTHSKRIKCKPGYKRRSAYYVKRHNHKQVVSAGCIRNKKKKRTIRKKIGPLNKGTLRKFGYHTTESSSERQKALAAAVKKIGWLPVFRKLNAVAILTKRTSPTKSKIFQTDKAWVRKKYYMV